MKSNKLGNKIQELLDEKNISRKQFSEMTGLTESAISRYCTGTREPKSITLAVIAKSLNVSMDELLGTPCENAEELEGAIRLVARSANEIPPDKKKELINALIEFTK